MTSVDEIGQVIKYAAQLEKLLDNKFSFELEAKRISGVSLKGLGDKVKALESHLSDSVRRDLWVVVKIRNNVAHEGSLGNDNLANYVSRCEKIIKFLDEARGVPITSNTVDYAVLADSLSQDNAGGLMYSLSIFAYLFTCYEIVGTIGTYGHFGFQNWTFPFVWGWDMIYHHDLGLMVLKGIGAFILVIVGYFLFVLAVRWGAKRLYAVRWFLYFLLVVGEVIAYTHLVSDKDNVKNATLTVLKETYEKNLIETTQTVIFIFVLLCIFILPTLMRNFAPSLWCRIQKRFSRTFWFVNELFLFLEINKQQGTTVTQSDSDFSEKYNSRKPSCTFKDVAGMAMLKAQLLDAVGKHQKEQKNGILLSGDPGNGKTFIAEALAGELKWGFMPITIADIESRWVGQSTEQLKAVFDAAARSAPLVLFFDECDSLLRDRTSMMGGTNDESLKKANAFLTGVVDIRRNKNIIVIAASNYRDQLDAAAIRDGRFDFKIEVLNPDKEARLGLLMKFSKDVEFEEGVLDRLVTRWEGFSVVRIRSISEKILDNAKAQGRKIVGVKEAMAALRAVQGSSGAMLPEGTPKLEDLRFDPDQRAKLMSLAKRMGNIEEVERLGGQVPKGVLFFGPPGTGKTAVAKALAMTSGWAFLPTSGNDLLSGDGKAIDALINKARDLRPCIIFIDEAENALGDRTTNPYGSAVTNKILAVTDGVNALHDVMFVAATNHPSQLDAAIVRGGRFSEHYEFKKPEEDTVLTMVREWLAERAHSTPFHEEFTPDAVAPYLHGKSPADIKDLLQQAVNAGVGRILSGESAEKKINIGDLKAVMKV